MSVSRNLRTRCLAFALPLLLAASFQAGAVEPDFIVGVCTHRWTEPDVLPTIEEAGVMAVRDEISWSKCEKTKGVIEIPSSYGAYIDSCLARGLTPLNILDYSNKLYDNADYPKSPEAVEAFVRYCEAVVREFKGRIKYYQVWNEWDGGCGGMPGRGEAEPYVKLLSAVYPRIKAIDPSITVIANSVCTGDEFFDKTVALGVMKHCDALALHTYVYGDPMGMTKWYARMLDVDKRLRAANGGKPFPLYITEIGWPNFIGSRGSTEEFSADCLARVYLLAKTMPYLKGVWWYSYRDDGWDYKYNENNFGLVRHDLTPKRPWFAMKDVARFISGASFVERIDAGNPSVFLLRYKKADGSCFIAAWSDQDDVDWEANFIMPKGARRSIDLTLIGCGSQKRRFVENSKDGSAGFQLLLRKRPFVIEGDVANVKLGGMTKRLFPESERPLNLMTKAPASIGRAARDGSGVKPVVYKFGDERFYRRLSEGSWSARNGASDLDASFSMRWRPDALLLDVETTDDVFVQNEKPDDRWKGDSVQLAFHKLGEKDGAGLVHSDFCASLTPKGPEISFQYPESASANGVKAKIERVGSKTLYKFEIPARSVGFDKFGPGSLVAFSILVNDNDGKGRKGYLHWGDGIGGSKEPTLYNWILLED